MFIPCLACRVRLQKDVLFPRLLAASVFAAPRVAESGWKMVDQVPAIHAKTYHPTSQKLRAEIGSRLGLEHLILFCVLSSEMQRHLFLRAKPHPNIPWGG